MCWRVVQKKAVGVLVAMSQLTAPVCFAARDTRTYIVQFEKFTIAPFNVIHLLARAHAHNKRRVRLLTSLGALACRDELGGDDVLNKVVCVELDVFARVEFVALGVVGAH